MRQSVKYLISGGLAATANLLVLYALTEWLTLWYLASSVISFLAGLVVSFVLHKYWTFGNTESGRIHTQAGIFTLIQLANLALNTLGLYVLVDYFHIWYLAAQVALIAALAMSSFFLFRRLFTVRSTP